MRKRYLIAAGAALLVATGGTVAIADADETSAPNGEARASGSPATVTLPTGDAVAFTADGRYTWHPAKGREDIGRITPSALDGSGDLITIPNDRIDELAAGKEDARRYNISELLRDGETDAGKAGKLSDKPYGTFGPAGTAPSESADDQKVTVTVTSHTGKPVAKASVRYINAETGDSGDFETDGNGTGKVTLPPGRYDFGSLAYTDSDVVLGMAPVTVDDKPVKLTVDGTKGNEVKYKVDRRVKIVENIVGVYSDSSNGERISLQMFADHTTPVYVIPSKRTDHPIGMEVAPHLNGLSKTSPYTYDLNFRRDGIPKNPTFTAHDNELAQVSRKYDGIASKAPTETCDFPLTADGLEYGGCTPRPVSWHSRRTEFFTPSPDIEWNKLTVVGDPMDGECIWFENDSTFEPGRSKHTVGRAPLSFSVGSGYSDEHPADVYRDGDELIVLLPFMENATLTERIVYSATATGKAVLKRDGKEVARADVESGGMRLKLPKKDAGRYTLSVDMKHDRTLTPLASQTALKWQFASKPTTGEKPVDVSAVAFDAEGVTNGYADVGAKQKFTLEYRPQYGAADTKLKNLVFEVSYDDGKTWKKVNIKVDGDKAGGTLKHPKGAKFVSVKASATDDAGNSVSHSTLRSYGLK